MNSKDNIHSFLGGICNQEVTIVSAFASGTENIVDMLLANGNTLELLIGTINSFSSPKFFDHCNSIEGKSFSFLVDFGYQSSIHWKLYLIQPDVVIIGSANFTYTGLNLMRDTCVVIKDQGLLKRYINELVAIKSSRNVINSNKANEFEDALRKYKKNHRRMQAGRFRSMQETDAKEWFSTEENQLIPIFIWDSRHTEDSIEKAHNLLEEEIKEDPPSIL